MSLRIHVVLIIILGLSSCEKYHEPEFDPEIIELKLTNYTLNFFRFDRMRDYEKDTLGSRAKQILRLKKDKGSSSESIFVFSIVIDWEHHQSHVLVEPNAQFVNPEEFQILWKDFWGIRGLIFFEQGNKKNHLEFASQVLEQIERGCEFYLKSPSGYLPILTDAKSRNALHITMLDYYGLMKSL